MQKRFWALSLALGLSAVLLVAVGVVFARPTASPTATSNWTAIFTDTFSTPQPVWSITSTLESHEWGLITYTHDLGGGLTEDRGLWAAGGGSLGSAQSWPTGTYTNGMTTVAVAGPFALTEGTTQVRLTVDVLNQTGTNDHLWVELSNDGITPPALASPVPTDAVEWQTVERTAGPFEPGDQVWVLLKFESDEADVDTGPLLDNLVLETLDEYRVFFPVIMKRWPPIPYPLEIWIDPDDGFGNYTVNWSHDTASCPNCEPTEYRLQEATDPAFSNVTLDITIPHTSRTFTEKPYNRYYRVRGINDYGVGDWSRTVSPSRGGYFDFSDPTSGWFTGWAERHNEYWLWGTTYISRTEEVAYMSYDSGYYQMYVPLTWQGHGDVYSWFVWPAEMAPLPASASPLPDTYCVETRGRVSNAWDTYQPWWSHWGLVFGSNEDRSEIYTFQINSHGNLGIVGFHNYVYPGDRDKEDPVNNQEWPIYRWPLNEEYEYWSGAQYGNGISRWDTLRAEVTPTHAKFYVNGYLVAIADNLGGMPRDKVGLIGGDFEVTPVEIQFDYFLYEPNCDIR